MEEIITEKIKMEELKTNKNFTEQSCAPKNENFCAQTNTKATLATINQNYTCKTPIVFIIFNRADTAQKVFDVIKSVRPSHLIVIADGARDGVVGEKEAVEKTRRIIEGVDWPCRVDKDFSSVNLGCKKRVSSGLDFAFSKVDKAIILEDDCLADKSFFAFCEELLERYENDERVMMISGDNKTFGKSICSESYYFSRQVQIWGWATWRRAWCKNDIDMKDWQNIKKQKAFDAFSATKQHRFYWQQLFELSYNGHIKSWDGQWTYSVWKESGLAIVPAVNLVQNIGFSKNATHTKDSSIFANMQTFAINFPLVHPKCVIANAKNDKLEMHYRLKEAKRLPYPLDMWASKLKWFLLKNCRKSTKS